MCIVIQDKQTWFLGNQFLYDLLDTYSTPPMEERRKKDTCIDTNYISKTPYHR